MATVQIAAVQPRQGHVQTPARNLPAGSYSSIRIDLINGSATPNDWRGSADFVVGDQITGEIDVSFDGGATWQPLISAVWPGGGGSPRDGSYNVERTWVDAPLVVPAGSQYRALADIVSHDGTTITFGVTATVTLAP